MKEARFLFHASMGVRVQQTERQATTARSTTSTSVMIKKVGQLVNAAHSCEPLMVEKHGLTAPTNVSVSLLSIQFANDDEGWAIGRGGRDIAKQMMKAERGCNKNLQRSKTFTRSISTRRSVG